MNSRPIAVVSGTSRGLGAVIAKTLMQNGYDVYGVSRSPSPECLPGRNIIADVADRNALTAKLHAAIEKGGRIQAVIANAGTAGMDATAEGLQPAEWDRILNTNLTGAYNLVHACMPYLENGKSRIVCIASTLSQMGVFDMWGYAAAKHGLIGMVRSAAMYFGPRQITVNAVSPGWLDTDMAAQRRTATGMSQKSQHRSSAIGRMAELSEVADLVKFLVSPAAASITGQNLVVDGGSIAGYWPPST